MRHLKLISALGVAGLLVAAGLAVAQTYPPPQAPTIHNTTDLIQIVPNGIPSAQAQFAAPGQISNAPQYVKNVVGAAGTVQTTYTNYFAQAQTYVLMILTATEPYGYSYSALAPSDGARECTTASGGTITNFYFQASGTQTVTGGAVGSLSSGSSACFTYSLSNTTWDRS